MKKEIKIPEPDDYAEAIIQEGLSLEEWVSVFGWPEDIEIPPLPAIPEGASPEELDGIAYEARTNALSDYLVRKGTVVIDGIVMPTEEEARKAARSKALEEEVRKSYFFSMEKAIGELQELLSGEQDVVIVRKRGDESVFVYENEK